MNTEKITNEEKGNAVLPLVSGSGFISEPKTIAEFEHNAQFQFDNVSGWMSVKDYECALIKARCLVEALEKLVKQSAS
jgi:hypothetical protein